MSIPALLILISIPFYLIPGKLNAAPLSIILRRVKNSEKNLKEGKYSLALDKFKKSQSECETSSCDNKLKKRIKKGILNAHHSVINTLYDRGDYKEVIKACNIAIYEAHSNTYFKIKFLKKLAESQSILNLRDELKKTYREIYKLNISFNKKDWILWSDYYENIKGASSAKAPGTLEPARPVLPSAPEFSTKEIDEAIHYMKGVIKKKEKFQMGENIEDVSPGEYSKAINELEKIEKKMDQKNPEWAGVKEILGDAYKVDKKYIRAIQKYESIINMGNVPIINKLAILYLTLENPRPQKAIPILKKSIASSPDNFESLYLLGKSMHYLKNYKKAVSCYQSSLKINPVNPDVYMSLGKAYERQDNRRQDALIEYENAVILTSGKKEKLRNSMELAKIYKRYNLLQASLEQWKQILDEATPNKIKREAERHIRILKRELE